MTSLRSLLRRNRSEKLGLVEVIAMGVGGMVSGGIYAVLGVAMRQAGNAVPLSYLIAGVITLLTAYSYLRLTLHYEEHGGAFTFVEHATDNVHIAGFVGWVLVVGYIGVMAMYAFAFGAYTLTAARAIVGIELPQFLRPIISVLMVGAFVGLNLSGVHETGLFEDIAVYIKIIILFSLATLGIVFYGGDPTSIDFFNKGHLSPITGFAIIFVSYEGFQLLVYDYDDIENVEQTLPIGMYISIAIAILIYVSVSFMATLQLSPNNSSPTRRRHSQRCLEHSTFGRCRVHARDSLGDEKHIFRDQCNAFWHLPARPRDRNRRRYSPVVLLPEPQGNSRLCAVADGRADCGFHRTRDAQADHRIRLGCLPDR